jgi:hypothetical protein
MCCLASVGAQQDQMLVERIYVRTTIKSYPPDERRPLLEYLDSQRPMADKGMQLFADNKPNDLYELSSADAKKTMTLDEFKSIFVAFDQVAGKITSYEYRGQAILYPNDDTPMSELSKAKSQVWYAIKTTKLKGNGIFIAVKTARENGKPVVSQIQPLNYGDGMPPWLLYTDAPAKPQ